MPASKYVSLDPCLPCHEWTMETKMTAIVVSWIVEFSHCCSAVGVGVGTLYGCCQHERVGCTPWCWGRGTRLI